jgi:uncharacterized protein (TIGR03435 family)
MIMHLEGRQEKTYALVVGKNGARLRESTDPDSRSLSFDTKGHINFVYYSFADFAGFLTNALDRTVVDMTGLPGHYDISAHLDLAALKMGLPSALGPEAPEPLPSVFTAIQELGPKLESRDGVVNYVVIDRAEKVPIENYCCQATLCPPFNSPPRLTRVTSIRIEPAAKGWMYS